MADNEAVFVYTGKERIPRTVVHVVVRCVDSIPAWAFDDCARLRTVTLPEGLRVIGARAFQRCDSLEGIELPSSVSEIGDWAFSDCFSLMSVNLPVGLRDIGMAAFRQCVSLETVQVPSSVAAIGDRAFSGCSNLTSVLLPEGLRTIGRRTFSRCVSLKNIQVPSSVTKIGKRAFGNCTRLAIVLLPEGLREMEEGAFDGCSPLENFRFHPLSGRMESITFDDRLTAVAVQNKIAEISAFAKRGGQSWVTGRESLEQLLRFITYCELKETTTIIELALWKARIEVAGEGEDGEMQQGEQDDQIGEGQKDGSNGVSLSSRQQCRFTCGAERVIEEVLHFLLPRRID